MMSAHLSEVSKPMPMAFLWFGAFANRGEIMQNNTRFYRCFLFFVVEKSPFASRWLMKDPFMLARGLACMAVLYSSTADSFLTSQLSESPIINPAPESDLGSPFGPHAVLRESYEETHELHNTREWSMRQRFKAELAAKDAKLEDASRELERLKNKLAEKDEIAAREVSFDYRFDGPPSREFNKLLRTTSDAEPLDQMLSLTPSEEVYYVHVDPLDKWGRIGHGRVPLPYTPIVANDIRNWTELKHICSSSTSVNATLSPSFEMGNQLKHHRAIDFNGRHIEVWGNGNVLDARKQAERFFFSMGSAPNSFLVLHNVTLTNARVKGNGGRFWLLETVPSWRSMRAASSRIMRCMPGVRGARFTRTVPR
jgi:hypothetical protein